LVLSFKKELLFCKKQQKTFIPLGGCPGFFVQPDCSIARLAPKGGLLPLLAKDTCRA
jgi:hypothetical protein